MAEKLETIGTVKGTAIERARLEQDARAARLSISGFLRWKLGLPVLRRGAPRKNGAKPKGAAA